MISSFPNVITENMFCPTGALCGESIGYLAKMHITRSFMDFQLFDYWPNIREAGGLRRNYAEVT